MLWLAQAAKVPKTFVSFKKLAANSGIEQIHGLPLVNVPLGAKRSCFLISLVQNSSVTEAYARYILLFLYLKALFVTCLSIGPFL